MLGRKSYTQEELDHCQAAVGQQLAAYRSLVDALSGGANDPKARFALEELEVPLFNNMVLVLDRWFVHRLRVVTGKDGNPLNEVEMLCDSLMHNGGILRASNVVKLVPEQSVLKLRVGDVIRLTAGDFERLSTAFFAELEAKFL
jgi:hypothetical protein